MIVLIDGDCALCVGLIEWLGKRIPADKLTAQNISIVPGESDWGAELLQAAAITDFDSVVVIRDGLVLQESNAVLALSDVLPRRWHVLATMARIIPRPWRDALYRYVARHRISWFGRKEMCALESPIASVTYGPRGKLTRPPGRD